MNNSTSPNDAEGRVPHPAGTVSTIRGIRQVPGLRIAIGVIMALAVLGVIVPDPAGSQIAWASIYGLIATPLLRVVWLIHRWRQERDRTFIGVGIAMICVTAAGVGLALLQA